MSRALMYALVLPLFAAEVFAQFVAHDQQWTTVFAVLALGVLAVRYLLGPQTDDETCPPDCPKCRESLGEDL
ncbi:hypothetical protein [Streptomyces caniscabiei]|uniref:Uncharacterized protein n=1 Tax=Streptomyces caniscabiei TaxID=2746961 RepID=A0ABU4N2D0_9ACTN|nr:hypothetical protein [Streptomyces caniscabiei]MBE4740458.1 hypothetical protein [Streptomyces caniscabiei]MBE4761269.1 hypothetical protein [Streptomyces caniscabiei]MBE4773420.1 hypothetical protein [Streptomyces caniscabiei]MBE4790133.1 hypothetical protein [Streptomyces caniscabiei]MBE4799279.1 hypothetical protein [Streptomyces caniscabiei]